MIKIFIDFSLTHYYYYYYYYALIDPKRWSYTFQMFALLTRYHNIDNAVKHANPGINVDTNTKSSQLKNSSNIFISERCLDTDYNCFSQMLKDTKNMNLLESQIYDGFYKHFKSLSIPLKGIIHINTSPTICQQSKSSFFSTKYNFRHIISCYAYEL